MGPVVTISDAADDRLEDYRNLTDVELRRRHETAGGIFIAEGALVIRQLLASRYPVRSLLATRAKLAELMPDLAGAGGGAPVYVAGAAAMQAVCGFHFHRGALAVGERLPPPGDPAALWADASLVAVLEGVNDHENLGALFRNAAAFGVDAVLLGPRCADPLYRRSVRVSMGHVLRVPWAALAPWPAGIGELRSGGFRVLALTPAADARPLDEVAGSGQPTAVLVGSEGHGLSPAALAAADSRVRIPTASTVDSLNVATAAAIAFHHFGRHNSAGRAPPG